MGEDVCDRSPRLRLGCESESIGGCCKGGKLASGFGNKYINSMMRMRTDTNRQLSKAIRKDERNLTYMTAIFAEELS